MSYPVAYRSGSEQYESGAGFQGPMPRIADAPAPAWGAPEVPAAESFRGPRMSGPTAISSGVAAALEMGKLMLPRGSGLARAAAVARAAAAAARAAENNAGLTDHWPARQNGNVPKWPSQRYAEYAGNVNGWTLVCTGGSIDPSLVLFCGPFIVTGATSCDLYGQAANPAGECVDENAALQYGATHMSHVYEYHAFGSRYRFYQTHYQRALPDPDGKAGMPQTAPGHRPVVGPAGTPGLPPPLQPMLAPVAQAPPVVGFKDRFRNDEWHQVGPLPPRRVPVSLSPGLRQPPLPGEKERKMNKAGVVAGVRLLANVVTESVDFLEALWNALPKDARTLPKCKTPKNTKGPTVCPGGPGWDEHKNDPNYRRVRQTPQTMLKDVYNGWDQIDWPKALYNQQQSEATDRSIGRPASETNRNAANNPYFPGGGHRGFWGPAM